MGRIPPPPGPDRVKGSNENNFSLHLCCEKSLSGIFFIFHTVMVDTSLY